jgi:hypothetical protein
MSQIFHNWRELLALRQPTLHDYRQVSAQHNRRATCAAQRRQDNAWPISFSTTPLSH